MERNLNNTHDATITPKGLEVICAPARSGKTSRIIDLYRSQMHDDGTSSCMIITPNSPSQRFLKNRLVDPGRSNLVVKPNITTFTELAGRILADNNSPAQNISALKRHLILSGIISRLNREKKLQILGDVSDTPGLVSCVDSIISQLKRAAGDPEDLKKITSPNLLRQRDLVEIYSQYQLHLQNNDLVDVEGQMWLARDLLKSTTLPDSLAGITTVAVDGFTDFTPTQLEILETLCRLIGSVVITLPLGDDNRSRMWFWTNRTLDRIKKTFGDKIRITTLPADNPSKLHQSIFDTESKKKPDNLAPNLIAAHSSQDEITRVAFEIKKLILTTPAPTSIAVLCNSLPQYHDLIYRVFKSYDIPVAPPATALADIPPVRFIMDFARLGPTFGFEKMLAVISNSYFIPESLGDFTAQDVNVAAMIIRECNVLKNQQAYLQAAEKLLTRLNSHIIDDEGESQTISLGPMTLTREMVFSAIKLFNTIFQVAEEIAQNPASAIRTLGLYQAVLTPDQPELVSRDLRSLKLFETICQDDDVKAADINSLAQALSMISNPPARSESLVDVISVLDARCLRYDHVFIVGMNEGVFPMSSIENSLLSAAHRQTLIQRGIPLDSRFDLAAREMLLFYLAITRPNQSLTLSYVKSDASGQSKAQSSFIETLEALFENINTRTIPAGQIIPPSEDQLVSREEILTAGIWSILNPQSNKIYSQAARWMKDNTPSLLENISRGIFARNHRYASGAYDNFDGVLSDKNIIKNLNAQYPTSVVFSASMLNCYGICPWQFFAKYLLKLKPLAVPAQQLQPTTHGTFVHDVLFSFFTQLRQDCSGPVDLKQFTLDQLHQLLEKHVYIQAQSLDAKALYPQLWDVTKNQILKMLRRYMVDITSKFKITKHSPRPAYFELAFGMETQNDNCDPSSTNDFAAIDTPHGPARLRGKIDRIDLIEAPSEKPSCIVVDCKTSSLGARNNILQGRNLQPVLYTLATQQLWSDKFSPCGGALHQITSAWSSSRELNFNDLIGRNAANYEKDFEAVIERVVLHIENMRDGNFQVHPTCNCPSYCPFRKICNFSPARKELKVSVLEEQTHMEADQ